MSNLRNLREAAGLRREDLAVRASISYDYVRRLETVEASNPTIDVARRIAAVLGLDVDDVFPPRNLLATTDPSDDAAGAAEKSRSVVLPAASTSGANRPTAGQAEASPVRAGDVGEPAEAEHATPAGSVSLEG